MQVYGLYAENCGALFPGKSAPVRGDEQRGNVILRSGDADGKNRLIFDT